MTDHLRFPYDRPDHYDESLDPPFNRRIRHNPLSLGAKVISAMVIILLTIMVSGAIGTAVYYFGRWTGIVE